MRKEHLRFIIPLVILFVILAILSQRRANKRGVENFQQFNNAAIAGRIQTKVSIGKGSARFKIEGKEYSFHPYTSDLNENSIFEFIAEPGDSILKGKQQDTLYLFKQTKVLKYTFFKFPE